jgi:organic radical activating enzyme
MINQSCKFLSNGYKFHVNNQGNLVVRPCCLYKTEHVVQDKQDLDLWRNTVSKIDSYVEPNCSDCNFLDQSKVRESRRDLSFRMIDDSPQLGDPTFLEIQIDATCNGGCIMCGPWSSSYWAQELKIVTPIKRQEDYLGKIASLVDLQQARTILLLGGEPMLSTVDARLIDLIQDPSQVTIQFTTNGSIYPNDAQIKRWEKFKQIKINFSVDGVADKFEYVRYPLNWNTVEQNILRMQTEMPGNISFKINHAVNILNLLYFDEFESWFNAHFSNSTRMSGFTASPVAGTLTPRIVTAGLRDKVFSKYSSDQVPARMIETVAKNCNDVKDYLDTLDKRRKNNWKQVFPSIANCL